MKSHITEVSGKFDLSQDTLRYYERIGLIPRVNRNKSGIKDYTEEDCNWVEFIKRLGTVCLTFMEFSMKEFHPRIATGKYTSIEIEINDNTPKGIIPYLIGIYKVKPIRLDLDTITLSQVISLCEIYRDNSAELKFLFKTDKEKLRLKLKELCI